jgi:CubicO group peptidase (beta-lactamase class C family)
MKGDELYYIYSVSKVMTATAALQLYERGLFSLDDPLSKYHSGFAKMLVRDENGEIREAKNTMKVRDLFCMTAGFNYRMKGEAMLKFVEGTNGICPTRLLADYLCDAVLDFEPGTKWQYSLCHDLLGAFIEIWSGERFGEYVRKNIFVPSGMTNSTFYLPPEERGKLCPQYTYNSQTGETLLTSPTNVYSMWPEYESGGGGCVSTAEDMIKFGEALRTGKLLKQETLDMMTTNQIPHCMDSFIVENYSYGLGVRCSRTGSDEISDFGWGGAAGSGIWIDRKLGFTVYYAQHVLNSPVMKKRNRLIFTVKECLGFGENSQVESADDNSRDAFAAKYGN